MQQTIADKTLHQDHIADTQTLDKYKRNTSIDFLRGIVMIIMALDHVRDFFHVSAQTANPLDLNTTTPPLFFTRWITHFCAPTFVFLSGISAYLSARNKSVNTVSSFLIKRGFWLIVVDFIVMSFALTFNPFYNFIMLTVLWAIGCSMILLGIFLKMSPGLLLPVGLLLFLVHDLVSMVSLPEKGAAAGILKVLFSGVYITPIDKTHLIGFFYAILPWASVLFLGYWFGKYVSNKRNVFITGISLVALFLLLRLLNIYGDPQPWHTQRNFIYTALSFFNTTKYPPSLQFLAMTLGPALLILAAQPKENAPFQKFASVYGRVPFFYFVVHFFLAHLLLVIAFFISGHTAAEITDPKSPILFRPFNFGFSLPAVYGVWLSVVLLLYYPCRWFYGYKMKNKKWWLRYL